MRTIKCDYCGATEDVAWLRITMDMGFKGDRKIDLGDACSSCTTNIENTIIETLKKMRPLKK